MPFKKGQSGNPYGRLTEKLVTDAMRIAAKEIDPKSGKQKLRVAAEQIVNKAVQGDLAAFAILADRLEGKPLQPQKVDHTIDDKRNSIDEFIDAELADGLAFLRRRKANGTHPKANGSKKPDRVH